MLCGLFCCAWCSIVALAASGIYAVITLIRCSDGTCEAGVFEGAKTLLIVVASIEAFLFCCVLPCCILYWCKRPAKPLLVGELERPPAAYVGRWNDEGGTSELAISGSGAIEFKTVGSSISGMTMRGWRPPGEPCNVTGQFLFISKSFPVHLRGTVARSRAVYAREERPQRWCLLREVAPSV